MIDIRDEFLSEEDLDLRNLSDAELHAWWDEWLRLAQSTNEFDRHVYSHGVFMLMGEPAGGEAQAGMGIDDAVSRAQD